MWLSLPLGDSARVRSATRLAWWVGGAGLVLGAGVQWQAGFAGGAGSTIAGGLAGLLLLGWAATRVARRTGLMAPVFRGRGSTLLVDTDGTAFLQPPAGGLIALDIRHTVCVLGVAWIAALGEGHRYSLLSGADQVDDGQWRRLNAWLRWRARGGG